MITVYFSRDSRILRAQRFSYRSLRVEYFWEEQRKNEEVIEDILPFKATGCTKGQKEWLLCRQKYLYRLLHEKAVRALQATHLMLLF